MDTQKVLELNKVVFGPFIGELGWELFRWAGYIRWVKQQYPEKDVVVATRSDRVDLYRGSVNEIYTFDILGDYSKYKPNCYALNAYPASERNRLIDRIKEMYPNHTLIPPPDTGSKNFFKNEQMVYNFAPHKDNKIVIDSCLIGGKIPIVISPRHRLDVKSRNWIESYWEDLYALLDRDQLFKIFIVGKSPTIAKPDSSMYECITVVENLIADNEGLVITDIGLTIEAIKASKITVGQQSALPILSNYLSVPTLMWGHEEKRHTLKENPLGTKCMFVAERGTDYMTSPAVIYEHIMAYIQTLPKVISKKNFTTEKDIFDTIPPLSSIEPNLIENQYVPKAITLSNSPERLSELIGLIKEESKEELKGELQPYLTQQTEEMIQNAVISVIYDLKDDIQAVVDVKIEDSLRTMKMEIRSQVISELKRFLNPEAFVPKVEIDEGRNNKKLDIVVVGVFDNQFSSSIYFSEALSSLTDRVKSVENFDYRAYRRQTKSPSNMIDRLSSLSQVADLMVIFKGSMLPVTAIREAASNCTTFLWFMDWYKNLKPSSNIPEFSKHCHYRSATGWETSLLWGQDLGLPVYHILDGVDPNIFYPVEKAKEYDVIFIGGEDKERTRIYDSLKGVPNLNVRFFGPSYSGGFIYPEEFRSLCSKSKIVLNMSRGNYAGYSSLRLWSALACGSFVLTKKFPEMEKHLGLIAGYHIGEFDGIDDLQIKIQHYLLQEKERETIALNGLSFAIDNRTWVHVAEEVLDVVDNEPKYNLLY